MTFSAAIGETLLLPMPYGKKHHLFIIITRAAKGTNSILIVGLETTLSGSDQTVVLHPGDHPFIKHTSSVNYRKARIVTAEHLINLVNQKLAFPQEPCNQQLLEKIQKGVRKSPFTSRKNRDFFEEATWPLK